MEKLNMKKIKLKEKLLNVQKKIKKYTEEEKNLKKEIEELDKELNLQKFNEINDVVDSKNIDLNKLLNAIKNGENIVDIDSFKKEKDIDNDNQEELKNKTI